MNMGEEASVTVRDERMSIEQVKDSVRLIQEIMRSVMQEGTHFGTIPGCQKPSLFKPGAEKLSVTFRLAPYYTITQTDLPREHREYNIVCTLKHIVSGDTFAQGVGSCSTMESKYRYREGKQKCPQCQSEAIIKGKAEYGGGWLCYAKKGGCGAKFKDGDPAIEGQQAGRIECEDPADRYNTVLKMAKKRAHVDATLTATAASDIFTQDVEDFADNGHAEPPKVVLDPFIEMVDAEHMDNKRKKIFDEYIPIKMKERKEDFETFKQSVVKHKRLFWAGFNEFEKNYDVPQTFDVKDK
jgi:hypothetical protein